MEPETHVICKVLCWKFAKNLRENLQNLDSYSFILNGRKLAYKSGTTQKTYRWHLQARTLHGILFWFFPGRRSPILDDYCFDILVCHSPIDKYSLFLAIVLQPIVQDSPSLLLIFLLFWFFGSLFN
jgi:hypothetical protein